MPVKTKENSEKNDMMKLVRKRKLAVKCFICFIIFTAFLFSHTISAQYSFDSFTTDNGLPQNGVSDVVQTPDGYLWFTTFDGLVRYDGAKFVVFDKNNTPEILSNRFLLLRVEADGSLLAGTEDGGLTVYQNSVFRTYTVADGLPSNKLTEFSNDVHGKFYVGTAEGKSYFRGGKFFPVPEPEISNNNRFYRSQAGNIWLYDADGIRENTANGEQRFYPISVRTYNEKLTGIKLFEDRKGNLWFGDLNGVYRYQVPLTVDNYNATDSVQTRTLTYSKAYTQTSSWSASDSITVGISVEFTAVPVLDEGNVTISASATHTYSWGTTESETNTITAEVPVNAGSYEDVKCTAILQQREFTIPYSGNATYHYQDGAVVPGTISGSYSGTTYFLMAQTTKNDIPH